MTRIVAGAYGGRGLRVPQGGTRPTSDRVREALFSALDAMGIDGAAVLDLYAGSGALGIEALSRGGRTALFVESDGRAVRTLRDNLAALGIGGARVLRSTVAKALACAADFRYDVVLADPPYAVSENDLAAVLESLCANGWLAPGAIVVVERAAAGPQPRWPRQLRPLRTRRYGDTALHWATTAADRD